MGILETWSRQRTKRIQARNKRKGLAKAARAQSRADVAEATGTRAGSGLAAALGSVGSAAFGAGRDAGTSRGPRGGAGAGGRRGSELDTTTALLIGGGLLALVATMGKK